MTGMKYVGDLHGFYYEVAGHVFVVDDQTLLIQNFNYTGDGPGAYFWVGTMGTPRDTDDSTTAILAYPFDGEHHGYTDPSPTALGKVENKNITLTLPPHIQAREVAWLSVWCKPFSANFGQIIFPADIDDDDDDEEEVEEEDDDEEEVEKEDDEEEADNRGTEETETYSTAIDDGNNTTEQDVVESITEDPALTTTGYSMSERLGKSFKDKSEVTSGEEEADMNVNPQYAMCLALFFLGLLSSFYL